MPGIHTFTDRQQDLLRALLNSTDGLTVDQLAQHLEISRNAVNQHLANLKNDDHIESETVAQGRGRPSKVYKLTPKGRELFPRHYDLFSNLLVGMLRDRIGKPELVACMRMLGSQLAHQFVRRIHEQPDLEHRWRESAQILQELGYEAALDVHDSDFEIVAKNCVFHKLAESCEEVCELDISLLSALLNTPIEQRECMVRGGHACRFGVPNASN